MPVPLSAAYSPFVIKGLTIHPEDPFLFDFLFDAGHSGYKGDSPQLRTESQKLIKYFLASLTLPEKDLWVNLSPYEKNRIIPEQLGQTILGQEMLAQDYILKQLTASLINPNERLGEEFWRRVYEKAGADYKGAAVPVSTFNKVWIVADKANVYVNGSTAFIVGSHLKVMLEEDYLALTKNTQSARPPKGASLEKDTRAIGSNILREIILPELEREVNEGKNFAALRQIFHSMVLATWFKNSLKQSLLNKVYADKAKITGVDGADRAIKEKIYRQYLEAYKKGVFNFIKEEIDPATGENVPKKYFSGGLVHLDMAQTVDRNHPDAVAFAAGTHRMFNVQTAMQVRAGADAAMLIRHINWDRSVLPQILKGIKRLDHARAKIYAQLILGRFLQNARIKERNDISAFNRLNGRNAIEKALRDFLIYSSIRKELGVNKKTSDTDMSISQIIKEALKYSKDVWPDVFTSDISLKDKKILVTGGAGNVALPLIDMLLERGAQVVSLDRNVRPQEQTDYLRSGGNYTAVQADLTDQNALVEAMKGMDAVVHLGGASIVSWDNAAETFDQNVNSTAKLLDAMRRSGVKNLVFASSKTVHDRQKSPYAATKHLVEQMISQFRGIKYVVLRFPNIAGAFQGGQLNVGDPKRRLLPAIYQAALSEQAFEVTADRNTKIGFISYAKSAEAALRGLQLLFNDGDNQMLDIVPKESFPVEDIVERARGRLRERGIEFQVNRKEGGIDTEGPSLFEPKLDAMAAIRELGLRTNEDLDSILSQVERARLNQMSPQPLVTQKSTAPPVEREEAMFRILKELKINRFIKKPLKVTVLLVLLSYFIPSSEDTGQQITEYVLEHFQRGVDLTEIIFERGEYEDFFKLLNDYKDEIERSSAYKKKNKIQRVQYNYLAEIIKALTELRSLPSRVNTDLAQISRTSPGGIDLNAKNLIMEIAGTQNFSNFVLPNNWNENFSGVTPLIIKVFPIDSIGLLLSPPQKTKI